MPTTEAILPGGGVKLSNSGTFTVAANSTAVAELALPILPAYPIGGGMGRLVHPNLGAFDYETKPDEWVNVDTDVIIKPVWAGTRTLTKTTNVLWQGNITDVLVEERWKALGGLAMPITQLRMLAMMFQNPIDPAVGYVQWYPNYINPQGYNVVLLDLTAGGDSITFDDVVNAFDPAGDPFGWMTNPVTLKMRIVGRI